MALDPNKTVEIIEIMEKWKDRVRPPKTIRPKLDIGYKIINQSLILFEIRPSFKNPSELVELPFAKIRYVNRNDLWKLYWMRGNLDWTTYEPMPTAKNLKVFVKIVEDDTYGCFKG